MSLLPATGDRLLYFSAEARLFSVAEIEIQQATQSVHRG